MNLRFAVLAPCALAILVGPGIAFAADIVKPAPVAAPQPPPHHTFHAWLDAGIMANTDGPSSGFNGPVVFPDQDHGQVNQAYASLERTAPSDNKGLLIGGRLDALFGSDFLFLTSAGFDGTATGAVPKWGNAPLTYGFAVPQLYGEIDWNALKVKVGHFFTIIGAESAMANANFFYTHSYAFQYGEPSNHTGVLASAPVGSLMLTGGVVEGWSVSSGPGARANFLGGVTAMGKWGSLALNLSTGSDSTVFLPGVGPFANRTLVNAVGIINLSDKLVYTFDANYGAQQQAATLTGTATAHWYGISNQLVYTVNDKWSVGGRLEWFRDNDGFNVTGLRLGNPLVGNFFAGNFYEASFGVNFKPHDHVTIRPEVRYDWFTPRDSAIGSQFPYDDNTKQHQLLVGLDLIAQF